MEGALGIRGAGLRALVGHEMESRRRQVGLLQKSVQVVVNSVRALSTLTKTMLS